jgi:protein ImuA
MPACPQATRRIPIASAVQLHKALWQGDQLATPPLPACPSGFDALDAELPGGGWPAAGLTDLLLREPGSGEIQLLAPALARLAEGAHELVWVAPPYPPYAPALHALDLPLSHLVWVQPDTADDAAWAAEQVLRSGSAAAVLWWSRQALPATLRRLHLAAQEGCTPLFAFRPWEQQQLSSPAPLRLALEPAAAGTLRVHLLKRRGPSLAQPLLLAWPDPPARERALPTLPAPIEDVVVGPAPALAAA